MASKFFWQTLFFLALAGPSQAIPAIAWGERSYGAVDTSEPHTYLVRMQTEVTVPSTGPACTQIRMWHAVPPYKPWTGTAAPLGATDLRSAPTAKLEPEDDRQSTRQYYENNRRFAPGEKVTLVTSFRVNSVKRAFNPNAVRTDWYAVRKQAVKPSEPTDAEVRTLAERLKGSYDPAHAVIEFCKWINANITYDDRVTYGNEDVRSILTNKRGHCGHMGVLLRQMCSAVGLNTRPCMGLILNKPRGSHPSADAPNDLGNIHTWVEVSLPNAGWVEVDPVGAEKCFTIPTNYVQNNTAFQNAAVWVKEDKKDTRPIFWSYENGRMKCDYNMLTRITYSVER